MTISPPAKITADQAITLITQMLMDMSLDKQLSRSNFGFSVRTHLNEMRGGLRDGRTMTARMENALHNWNVAIHRGIRKENVQ